MLLYLFIVGVFVLIFVMRFKDQSRKKYGSMIVLKSLQRTKFNRSLFRTEDECIICWNEYTENDDVVQLKCNDKHFFHSKCIEDWIKAGNNTCPMCREPISKEVQM